MLGLCSVLRTKKDNLDEVEPHHRDDDETHDDECQHHCRLRTTSRLADVIFGIAAHVKCGQASSDHDVQYESVQQYRLLLCQSIGRGFLKPIFSLYHTL